ncbi:MAG: NADH-quinone oxidoreductase subunit NuoN [Pantoea sp. Brub]|nr:NADH-quinone oxidoreductase subunit NuoN [Pantoea sp. Brub]
MLKQLILLLPFLIVGSTVIVSIISIILQRNHFINCILSVIGLFFALISLYNLNDIQITNSISILCINNYAKFYIKIILLISLSNCIFSYFWLRNFQDNKEEFYVLLLISTIGAMLLASSNNFIILFIGIELLSLPLFGLIGYAFRQKLSLEASLKYTILSSISSSFILFGIALVYTDIGSLDFITIGKQLLHNSLLQEPIFSVGFGMIIIGIGFKLSLVPFHLWTPDVYQGAPLPVSCFLATGSKFAIFSALFRLFTDIPITNIRSMRIVMILISFMSIIFGNLMAIYQNNIKRLLGYSSISHLGYLLITLIAIENYKLSLETTKIYFIAYLFSNLSIFGILHLVSDACQNNNDVCSLYSYRGLFWHKPILSIIMTIIMLSLAGIPITLGFIGKFYIIVLSISTHLWLLTIALVISSGLGLYYYLRIIISLYLTPPKIYHCKWLTNWHYTLPGIIVIILTFLIVLLGIYPQLLINILN